MHSENSLQIVKSPFTHGENYDQPLLLSKILLASTMCNDITLNLLIRILKFQ